MEGLQSAAPVGMWNIVEDKKLPKFDGTQQGLHPKEFVERLERHFKIRQVSEERKLDVAIEQLEGDVAIWANSTKRRWETMGDFQCEFLQRYWSEDIQHKVLVDLLRPRLYNSRFGSMTHHVWFWVKKTQYMEGTINQKVLIDALIKHFPHDVASFLISSKISTVEELVDQLEKLHDLERRPPRETDRRQETKTVQMVSRGRGFPRARGGFRERGPQRPSSPRQEPGNE